VGTALARLIRQCVEAVHRDHIAFKAQLGYARVGRVTRQVAPDCPLDGDLEIRRLLRGLGAVTAVGGQNGAAIVGEDQQRAVRSGKTR